MQIPLEEIMRREKFNDVEKALVNHPMLSQPDRIKIISEIKIAKSNERYSSVITQLTILLAFFTLLDFAAQVFEDSTVLGTQERIAARIVIACTALFFWVAVPVVSVLWRKKG